MSPLHKIINSTLEEFVRDYQPKLRLNKTVKRFIATQKRSETKASQERSEGKVPKLLIKDFMHYLPNQYRMTSLWPTSAILEVLRKRKITFSIFKRDFCKNLSFITVKDMVLTDIIISEVISVKKNSLLASPFSSCSYIIIDKVNNVEVHVPDSIKIDTVWFRNQKINKSSICVKVQDIVEFIHYEGPVLRRGSKTVIYLKNSKGIYPHTIFPKQYRKDRISYFFLPRYSYKKLPKPYPYILVNNTEQQRMQTIHLKILETVKDHLPAHIFSLLYSIHNPIRSLRLSIYNTLIYKTMFLYYIFDKLYQNKSEYSDNLNKSFKVNAYKRAAVYINKIYGIHLRRDQIATAMYSVINILNLKDTLIFADVGSGKTLTAILIAMYFQLAIPTYKIIYIVPTKILLNQITALFKRNRLLKNTTVSTIRKSYQTGETTASYSLAIIDEEQKFGIKLKDLVARTLLKMTATPIPLSLLNTKSSVLSLANPKRSIETLLYYPEHQANLFLITLLRYRMVVHISATIKGINQVMSYLDVKLASIAGKYTVYVLHGQLPTAKQKEIVSAFTHDKGYTILIATTVFEVGVDIPTLTAMFIWRPDRYGLSQLHQLRGRIGRAQQNSYCYLVVDEKTSTKAKQLRRINFFTKYGSGATLSYIDLVLRGSGDITRLSSKQHGSNHPCFSFVAVHLLEERKTLLMGKYSILTDIWFYSY